MELIFQAIRLTSKAVESGLLEPEDITEDLLERCFYTGSSSKVDLLIRTSGEVRLSDFLLWQSCYSVTYFTRVLWPDFTLRNLLAGVFYYQMSRWQNPDPSSSEAAFEDEDNKSSARIRRFLARLDSGELRRKDALSEGVEATPQGLQ
jgi:hypothetical protein